MQLYRSLSDDNAVDENPASPTAQWDKMDDGQHILEVNTWILVPLCGNTTCRVCERGSSSGRRLVFMTFHSLSPNEASQARQISTVAKHGPKGKKKDEERGDRKTDQLLTDQRSNGSSALSDG